MVRQQTRVIPSSSSTLDSSFSIVFNFNSFLIRFNASYHSSLRSLTGLPQLKHRMGNIVIHKMHIVDLEARLQKHIEERLRPVERRIGILETTTDAVVKQMEEDKQWREATEKRLDEGKAVIDAVVSQLRSGTETRRVFALLLCFFLVWFLS